MESPPASEQHGGQIFMIGVKSDGQPTIWDKALYDPTLPCNTMTKTFLDRVRLNDKVKEGHICPNHDQSYGSLKDSIKFDEIPGTKTLTFCVVADSGQFNITLGKGVQVPQNESSKMGKGGEKRFIRPVIAEKRASGEQQNIGENPLGGAKDMAKAMVSFSKRWGPASQPSQNPPSVASAAATAVTPSPAGGTAGNDRA